MSSTPHPKRRKSGWTPERRAKHAAAMRRWKPWKKSTGPRTKAGKARSSRNALIDRSLRDLANKELEAALSAQKNYLSEIEAFIQLQKIFPQNELLKRKIRNRRRTLRAKGRKISKLLARAYLYAVILNEHAFSPLTPWGRTGNVRTVLIKDSKE